MTKLTEAQRPGRDVLLLASYCGGDNPACSDTRPCPVCLGMSNVVRIPDDTKLEHVRELSPEWSANDHLARLTWREIGSARAALTGGSDA